MDDDGHVVVIEQPGLTEPCVIRQSELLAMAGPAESVLMPKFRSPHLLPIAQEIQEAASGSSQEEDEDCAAA